MSIAVEIAPRVRVSDGGQLEHFTDECPEATRHGVLLEGGDDRWGRPLGTTPE